MAKKLKLEISPKDLEMKVKEVEHEIYNFDDYVEFSLSELIEKYGPDAKIIIKEIGDGYESHVLVIIKNSVQETDEEYTNRIITLKNLVERNLAKVK